MRVTKYRKTGLLWSLTIHVILFMLLAFGGFFSNLHHVYATDDDIYTIDDSDGAAGGGNSGGGGVSGGGEASFSSSDIVLSNNDADKIDKTVKKEETDNNFQKEKLLKHTEGTIGAGNGPSSSTGIAVGSGAGTGNGTGTGSGSGSGSGSGNGTGNGSGDGSGSGNGSGNGSGSGDDESRLKVTVPPRPQYTPKPYYPEDMREADEEGYVVLQFVVNTDGSVASVTVVGSSGQREFEQAALAAGRQFTFSPGLNAYNESVQSYYTQPITFRLH
ncbi:energy transducer TonB [Pectinatus frisingensis]|uniref:energy transducer TonB n=1 Tax=Pectinatus frisingensis TaxID=865 RepID=UPI0018C67386|nr:energy transducer TonB [Pectinatus frisingensis]